MTSKKNKTKSHLKIIKQIEKVRAKNNKKATLIELIIDPNVLTPSIEIGKNIG